MFITLVFGCRSWYLLLSYIKVFGSIFTTTHWCKVFNVVLYRYAMKIIVYPGHSGNKKIYPTKMSPRTQNNSSQQTKLEKKFSIWISKLHLNFHFWFNDRDTLLCPGHIFVQDMKSKSKWHLNFHLAKVEYKKNIFDFMIGIYCYVLDTFMYRIWKVNLCAAYISILPRSNTKIYIWFYDRDIWLCHGFIYV